jgi:DNA-binding transcriptional ArsR family regulator
MCLASIPAPIVHRKKEKEMSKFNAKNYDKAARYVKNLGDGTRLALLAALVDGPKNVTELVAMVGSTSQPAISHHLALLRNTNLVEPTRDGKNNIYSLTDEHENFVKGFLDSVSHLVKVQAPPVDNTPKESKPKASTKTRKPVKV